MPLPTAAFLLLVTPLATLLALLSKNPVVDGVVAAAAVTAALAVIWRQVLRPLTRSIHEIADSVPILAGIAKEFRPNGGGSLRDQIDGMKTDIAEGREAITETAATVQALSVIVNDLATTVAVHDENNAKEFERVREGQASMSLQLRNIQQAQHPPLPTSTPTSTAA